MARKRTRQNPDKWKWMVGTPLVLGLGYLIYKYVLTPEDSGIQASGAQAMTPEMEALFKNAQQISAGSAPNVDELKVRFAQHRQLTM